MKPLETHPRPVNMQAAKVFWKAPWWAKLLQAEKEELIRVEIGLEDLVDTMRPPPVLPGNAHSQIRDWRGVKIKHRVSGNIALVLGYAYARNTAVRGKQVRKLWWTGHGWAFAEARETERTPEHRWYAFYKGLVQVVNIRKWRMAGNYEPLTPPGPDTEDMKRDL